MSTSTPSNFVDLPFVADPVQLGDGAVANLQASWPDWLPSEANLETIVIESIAPMAAAAIQQGSQMPAAAFRVYGTKVLGIAYNVGSPSLTTVTITTVDDTGWTVPAGSQLEIDSYAFQLIDDAIVPVGSTSISGVQVEATLPGQASNGLPGSVVGSISMPAFVDTITVEIPTADGTDPEDDPTYQSRVSVEMQLRGQTLVTARDYVALALIQPGISRAVCIGNMARQIQVALADANGMPVPQPIKDAYIALVNENRLINIEVDVEDPEYTTVDVTYDVLMYPGFQEPDVVAACNAFLAQILSPVTYSQPNAGQGVSSWINDPVIRPNYLIAHLATVPGVRIVLSVEIGGAAGDGTLTLPGTFPLPQPGTFTGTAE